MGLPQFLRKTVEKKFQKYCDMKVPEAIRYQLRLEFKIRGNNVTLIEERPAFGNPDIWISIPIAQFRYNPDDETWYLYCCYRNLRWHLYHLISSNRDMDVLIREVEKDPTGIFWG